LEGYTVGWNNSELGPYKSRNPRSPTKVKFDLDVYKINNTERVPSPVRKSSLKSTESDHVDLNAALYSPGSVLTRMQSEKGVDDLEEYEVKWNKMELYTGSSAGGPSTGPSTEKDEPIKKSGKYVRAESFQISPTGHITYH
jgi:hypothetical protein